MPVRSILFLTLFFSFAFVLQARSHVLQPASVSISSGRSMVYESDSLSETRFADSLSLPDSIRNDTIFTDSLDKETETGGSALEDEVYYSADDSMIISLDNKILYLYGNASVKYQDIELNSDYIELNMDKEEVFARGVYDSSGIASGSPLFKQGSEEFESDSITYNFDSEKGIIYQIISQQGEGYLHSAKTKRHPQGHIHIKNGKYTTCDAEHPHFYLALRRGIVIPEDKIVTGYAYMVLEDIPIKVPGIPFGFFPNTTSRSSGILIPSQGTDSRYGYYLRDGGWYQVLGEHADLTVMFDKYSKGRWELRNNLKYALRYKFTGNLRFDYGVLQIKNDITKPEVTKQYKIVWRHVQDAKANPNQTFSASVNFSSTEYDNRLSYNPDDYLNSTKSSSINYSKDWPGAPFRLSLGATATQNDQSKTVSMNLPTGTFDMIGIYPLRKKEGSGEYKWYENISLKYNLKFKNEVSDTMPLSGATWSNMKNAAMHSIPLRIRLNVGKLITISPSLNYDGVFYTQHTRFDSAVYNRETNLVEEFKDTIRGFEYSHAVNPTVSVSIAPKITGMYMSSKEDSYIEAVRHIMNPSAGISFTPDMRSFFESPYDSIYYTDTTGNKKFHGIHNKYEDQFYPAPLGNGKRASLTLTLNNNLEMKVRPKNDTTGESKKVSLLDNLNFSANYNPFKDSIRWSSVSMITGTKLFNNKFTFKASGSFSPYALDSLGRKIDEFYLKNKGGVNILRFETIQLSSGFSLRPKSSDKKKEQEEKDAGNDLIKDIIHNQYYDTPLGFMPGFYPESYVDFDIPWSFTVRYRWSFTQYGTHSRRLHSFTLSGDLSLTPNWKINFNGGYDIENREVTHPKVDIYRDLHCWSMSFSVVPSGPYKYYAFTIKAKSSLLSDLKYDKKTNRKDEIDF